MGVEAKKFKRNHRIVFICQYLMEHPNQLVTLSFFADYFDSAKSSISEDINFVRDVFQENDLGDIRTVAGVSGGIIFYPTIQERDLKDLFIVSLGKWSPASGSCLETIFIWVMSCKILTFLTV